MLHIKDQKADITVVSEANFKFNDPKVQSAIKKSTKGYHIEQSAQSGPDNSRCIMIISKKIPYERVHDTHDNENPVVYIKVKYNKYEKMIIIGHYRQWRKPGDVSLSNKDGIKKQVLRFNI